MKGEELFHFGLNLGLSDKESQVLTELIIHGELRMRELARRVNLKRVTVYAVVKLLEEKGLAGTIKKGKVQYAFALHPDNLTGLINLKKKKIESLSSDWDELYPDVLSVFNQARTIPSVQFFEGFAGLQKVYDNVLAQREEVWLIRSRYDNDHPELRRIIQDHIDKKMRRKIPSRVITPVRVSKERYKFEEIDKKMLVTRCMVPRSKLTLEAQIMIYGKYVALTAMKDDILTTVINNESINQTYRVLFEYIWQLSWPWHQQLLKKWKSLM